MTKRRSIFEDVGPGGPAPAAPASARRREPERAAIAAWLSVLFALVVAMIAVGGLTRLADAGLAITEWRPVTGALPPLDAAAWEAEFARYRETPQHALVNPDMTLAEFRRIYWWEWGHRQLGRAIGVVWGAGFLWFLVRRRIPPGWTPRLLGLGLLGGLQGAVGWWMVASGLAPDMVAVASHRLAVHLGLAFVILGLIAWWVMKLRQSEADLLQARRQRDAGLMAWGAVLVAVAFVQVLLGALVAGIDAGRSFPEWPLMAGAVFPPGAFELEPVWRNFSENAGLVQFDHRVLGYLLAALGVVAWLRARRSPLGHVRGAFDAMLAMLAVQVGLGIVTVITAAPWQVAIVHQLGAVALFVAILNARFAALYPRAERIARGPARR
jgi:cytochrome c oxidase assembly protein subunit 15